ncbi:MAG TPA: hypothetical protein VNI57_15990 [Candidatus Saccharimonadales bacterium]|nr:hypothetical protein [Candidatus Saccharimonadales bacterium]
MIQTVSPIRNRHLVREIDRGRVRELVVAMMLASLLLVPLLVYVWNQMEWIHVGYELDRLEKERVAQAELGSRLRIEKAMLSSLTRVEAQADRRLGLEPASTVVRLVEEPEGGPAQGQPGVQTGSLSPLPGAPAAEPPGNERAPTPETVVR